MRIYTGTEQNQSIRNITVNSNKEIGTDNIKDDRKSQAAENGKVFAGDFTIMTDAIAEKKKEAQEKAAKLIAEQFTADMDVDHSLKRMSERINELGAEVGDAQKQIRSLNEEKAKLKEEYGVTDDSQEQMDLELLEREAMTGSNKDFTEEEMERLAYMKEHPEELTDYQQSVLSRDISISLQQKIIDDNTKEIQAINGGIRGTKLELLKSDPMLKTKKAADGILEAANKAVIGMAMDDVKETIDEKIDEEKEKADRAEEEKKEQEERIGQIRQDNETARTAQTADAQGTDTTQDAISDSVQKQKDVEADIKQLLEKQKLLEEDLKGISVDEVL